MSSTRQKSDRHRLLLINYCCASVAITMSVVAVVVADTVVIAVAVVVVVVDTVDVSIADALADIDG